MSMPSHVDPPSFSLCVQFYTVHLIGNYYSINSILVFTFPVATKGRPEKANFAKSEHRQRLGQASQLWLVWEFGVFEPSFHSGDQCLCGTINQTSVSTLSEPVVYTSKYRKIYFKLHPCKLLDSCPSFLWIKTERDLSGNEEINDLTRAVVLDSREGDLYRKNQHFMSMNQATGYTP